MSAARKELQEALYCYTAYTLTYIHTVREFCEKISEWMVARKSESDTVKSIKDRFDQIGLKFSHVTQAKKGEKRKAFFEYMTSKRKVDSRREELDKLLTAVLEATLGGLKGLSCFLDAVEKLAVTSLHVFKEENQQVLSLPNGIGPERIQEIIMVARMICPLLLKFKRDAAVFFLPKLQNLEVLSYQLDKYIETTQKICEKFKEESSIGDFDEHKNEEVVVELSVDLSEDDIRRMLDHINQLDEIRMNPNFRMVFLFQEKSCCSYINEFSERKPRMLQFLKDLEESAVQLDRMNKGAKISSVAGSSVGVVSGVLSIVGLALIPVTAGVSLGLMMAGVGLGVTSGVNSVVTTATEMGVNRTQQKKASEAFQSFMEDVQSLQDCLEEAKQRDPSDTDLVVGVGRVLCTAGAVGKGIDSFVDLTSTAKVLAQENKALRLIVLNALFIGMDVFFICKDGISLAKGSETEFSQFIRARAALWSSEMDSWQKIHDSLCEGQEKSEKNKAILETPFYPEEHIPSE